MKGFSELERSEVSQGVVVGKLQSGDRLMATNSSVEALSPVEALRRE